MKISIVGANSYIARNLIFYINNLFDKKIELFLYDIQPEHKDNVKNYCQINPIDKQETEQIKYDVDLLFMFTGKTGTMNSFNDYENYIDINEISLLNVLDCLVKNKSKAKIIFPSTRLVYKGKEEKLKEESEKEFKTIYAINKYSCEQYLKMYSNLFDIRYCVYRICVPYGTLVEGASSYGTAEFMIGKAAKKEDITLFGGGEVRRTIIHIEDLCRALIEGSLSNKCINEVFNIGGEDYSLFEMAEYISKYFDIKVIKQEWPKDQLKIESGSTVFDSSKFDSLLNFKYKHSFVEWLKKNYE